MPLILCSCGMIMMLKMDIASVCCGLACSVSMALRSLPLKGGCVELLCQVQVDWACADQDILPPLPSCLLLGRDVTGGPEPWVPALGLPQPAPEARGVGGSQACCSLLSDGCWIKSLPGRENRLAWLLFLFCVCVLCHFPFGKCAPHFFVQCLHFFTFNVYF